MTTHPNPTVEGLCQQGRFDEALSLALKVIRELERLPLLTLIWKAQAAAGLWENAWATCLKTAFIARPEQMQQLLILGAKEKQSDWVQARLPELVTLDPELASKISLNANKGKDNRRISFGRNLLPKSRLTPFCGLALWCGK